MAEFTQKRIFPSLDGDPALQMIDDHEIVFGTPDDIPGILTIQEANLPHNGGTLSVRLSADWFQRAIIEKSLIVCRRESAVVGYLFGVSLASWGNVPIIKAILCAFPPQPDFYLYGPICVAETERGKGVAGAMFEELKARRRGRPACFLCGPIILPHFGPIRRWGCES